MDVVHRAYTSLQHQTHWDYLPDVTKVSLMWCALIGVRSSYFITQLCGSHLPSLWK